MACDEVQFHGTREDSTMLCKESSPINQILCYWPVDVAYRMNPCRSRESLPKGLTLP